MSLLVLSALWALLVLWLILRAFGQRTAMPVLHAAKESDAALPPLAVIVPARDEADNIGACLSSLLAQDYPADRVRILVVDDASSDATPAIVRQYAGTGTRIALLHAPKLPPGWKGKVNACCAGAAAAGEAAEWLCFLDADMRAEPPLLRSAVTSAVADKLDLLSLAPRHKLESFAERLIIPCGLYLLSFSRDVGKLQDPASEDAIATGQFMLIRRAAYDRAGGFAAVRGSAVEDLEFARLMKRSGARVLMQDGSRMLSTRMYTGWKTLRPGIAKNLVDMLGGPRALLATVAVTLAMAWAPVLLPACGAVACLHGRHDACLAAIPATLGAAAVFALHIAGASYFRIPLGYGLLFPLGYTAGALIALDSLRWRLTGYVRWKGRVYR